MKKSIMALAVVAVFAACNSGSKNSEATAPTQSAQAGVSNSLTDRQQVIQTEGVEDDNPDYVSEGSFTDKGKVVHYEVHKSTPVATAPRPVAKSNSGTAAKTPSVNTGTNGSGGVSQPTAQTSRKKGWSQAAKGAAIGAGSGAVLGAVISKKHGKGAIIGGIVGAGAGYALGRAKDKKQGRY